MMDMQATILMELCWFGERKHPTKNNNCAAELQIG
jgi:hypothetical protein